MNFSLAWCWCPPSPPSNASPWPGGCDEHQFHCTFEGCLHSFNKKSALTQHLHSQHISCPTPVVAPMSPLHSDPQTPQHSHPTLVTAPLSSHHSYPKTHQASVGSHSPLFFPDNDHPHIDFHYDNDDFIPLGLEESHQDGSHLPSSGLSPAHDNHTHLSSADGRESDSVE